MLHPRITRDFENDILELIDQQDELTRSDLQGMVTILVNQILEAGKKIPSNKLPHISKFYVIYKSPSERRPEVVQTFNSAKEARKYIEQYLNQSSAKTVIDRYSIAQEILL